MKASSSVVVVGAGIAGAWLGYRLAQRGVRTVVLRSSSPNTPLVSAGAAAVLNKDLFETPAPLAALYADETGTQHPELQTLVREYLPRELDELQRLVPYMTFDFARIPKHSVPAPRLGAGGELVEMLMARFAELGGTLSEGRVTHLAIEDGVCRGVQYERDGVTETLACRSLVIAGGGFSGLLPDSATPNVGSLHGMFLRAGGVLANLEFSYRFALGDLSDNRVLYPPDTQGARFLRNGAPAEWLERACAEYARERRDIDVFQRYWVHNLDVPHTLSRGPTSYRLGPIRGFSMGGIAQQRGATSIKNLYVTGEAGHDLAADCIVGLPWASYIATSGMLSDLLGERTAADNPPAVAGRPRSLDVDPNQLAQIRQRLGAFQDQHFSAGAAEHFIGWCRTARRDLPAERGGCREALLLAEAFAASELARCESRGYFFRGDYPSPDPKLAETVSVARYLEDEDRVAVELVPRRALREQSLREVAP